MHTLVVVCILYEYERVEYTTYRLLFSFLLQHVITELISSRTFVPFSPLRFLLTCNM